MVVDGSGPFYQLPVRESGGELEHSSVVDSERNMFCHGLVPNPSPGDVPLVLFFLEPCILFPLTGSFSPGLGTVTVSFVIDILVEIFSASHNVS